MNYQKNLAIFGRLLKIQLVYWTKNYMNIILGFGVSLFIVVCWAAFKSGDPFILVSGMAVNILRSGLIIYNGIINDWRTTKTNERLRQTPVPQSLILLSGLLFNFLTTLIGTFLIFAIGIIFFASQRPLVQGANWMVVISALLLVWITAICISYFVYKFVKHANYGRFSLFILYVFALYLLGLGFPIQDILSYHWVDIMLYFLPFRYAVNLAQAGYANYDQGSGSILIIEKMPVGDHQLNINFGYGPHLWVPYLCALGVLIVFSLPVLIKNFLHPRALWHHYSESLIHTTSRSYTEAIRQANTFQSLNDLHWRRHEQWKTYQCTQRWSLKKKTRSGQTVAPSQ